MATDRHHHDLLSAYLSGNISKTDKDTVENWISASRENQLLFEEFQKVWNSSGVYLQYPNLDTDELLQDLKTRIAEENRPIGKVTSMMKQNRLYWTVAAGICLLMVSYFIIEWSRGDKVVIEAGDEVATVYLPDSTKVWLNVGSRIIYAESFESRNIELQGEAFLSVRRDTSRFVVTTKHTKTTVLGTAFNVNNQSDSVVTLTVAEGSVEFSRIDSSRQELVLVKARQKAVYKPKKKLYRAENNDPSFADWREKNNGAFREEKNFHSRFLTHNFRWRKNQINQSVIEGTLKNSAGLAAYTNIVLEVTYTKPNGSEVTVELKITDTVYPGRPLQYRRRLLDILSDTQSIIVKIKSAEATSRGSY